MHLIGLVSDGGVHSSLEHLHALIELAATLEVGDLVVHAFTDGRDTPPKSGAGYPGAGGGMDVLRPGWAGSARSWAATTPWTATSAGIGSSWPTTCSCTAGPSMRLTRAPQAARDAYERDETDEFITPVPVGEEARIRPGDSVLAFNFRPDRMREITRALADAGFGEIDRGGAAVVERYATMTEYEEGWPYPVAFPPQRPATTLPAVIAARGERQLHVAETEKYPHVTYFFGGGEEDEYDGERRELVPSPRDVATYDEKPADERARGRRGVRDAWREEPPKFGIINFANADMVGHTGVIEAAVEAIETVDACLGEVVEAVHAVRRRLPDHRRPRQRRPHARARRQPQHRPLAEPGAGDRHRAGARAARRRDPGRRGPDDPAAAGDRAAGRDVRRVADPPASDVARGVRSRVAERGRASAGRARDARGSRRRC